MRETLLPVVKDDAAALRVLVSAHASHEELFAIRQFVTRIPGASLESAAAVSWQSSVKVQPAATKFKVPPVDAPNVAGARAMGFRVPDGAEAACDISGLRAEVESGAVKALYVVDPGPEGSIGDLQWVIDARAAGTLPLLLVQGVVMTPLAAAADIVLPGAAWVEKEAAYTNDRGIMQASARVMAPPGDAHEDWRVIADVATAAGITTELQGRRRRARGHRRSHGRRPGARRDHVADVSRSRFRRGPGSTCRTPPSAGSGTTCSTTCAGERDASARARRPDARGVGGDRSKKSEARRAD